MPGNKGGKRPQGQAAHFQQPVHGLFRQIGVAHPGQLPLQTLLGEKKIDHEHDGEEKLQNRRIHRADHAGGEDRALQGQIQQLVQLILDLIRGLEHTLNILAQIDVVLQQPLIQLGEGLGRQQNDALDSPLDLRGHQRYHQVDHQRHQQQYDQQRKRAAQTFRFFHAAEDFRLKKPHGHVEDKCQPCAKEKGLQDLQ